MKSVCVGIVFAAVHASSWLLLAGVCLLLAGCSQPAGEDGTRRAATLPDQGGCETGRANRSDHQFGASSRCCLPDTYRRRCSRATRGSRSDAAGAPAAAIFWCRMARRFSSLWTSARPRFRTARANWAAASALEIPAHPPGRVRRQHSAHAARRGLRRLSRTSCSPARNTRTPAARIFTSTA